MSARAHVRLVSGLALVGVLTVLPVGPGHATAPRADPLDILGGNMSFRVVDHNTEHRPAALRQAIRKARSIQADAITLQEICFSQVRSIERAHPTWTVSWHAERKVPWCSPRHRSRDRTRHPQRIGSVAIWTGGSNGTRDAFTFRRQYQHGWHLGMACVSYYDNAVIRVCSTHLQAGSRFRPHRGKVRRAQAREVKVLTDRWIAANELVVIAGDFNARPSAPELDNLYSLSGRGQFSEASTPPKGRRDCRCAKPTRNGHKIDYVFYSRNRLLMSSPRRLRLIQTRSDHHMLVSSAQVHVGLL